MNKNLLHKTDKFFLENLEDHVEIPDEHVWEAIEKKLSEKEKNKPVISLRSSLSIAALILCCIALPVLLADNSNRQFSQKKNTTSYNVISNNNAQYHSLSELSSPQTELHSSRVVAAEQYQQINNFDNNIEKDFLLATVTSSNNLNTQNLFNIIQPVNFHQPQIENGNAYGKGKTNAGRSSSITIRLPQKHAFSIMPFFSFDHISGRFIEQYEFDHLTINDYSKREKPDLSYTAGVLGSYTLNKKFSLTSGISFSSSMLSITNTAVNALRDAEGNYKFKLATSYGLAEISQPGIQPMAGDSLMVSGATMQFNYISFPVLINYNITGRKLKLAVHGGLALNNVISEKMEVHYNIQNNDEAETINKIEGIRSVFFTLNTGVEARYSIDHKTDISISPELRYGINSINKGTPIKTYPINYGLSFNFYLKF